MCLEPGSVGFCSEECLQHPPFLVIFQDRFCFVFLSLQSFDKCLWSIILTLNEKLAHQIVHTDGFRRVEFEVGDVATGWMMNPTSSEALPDELKEHVQVHHQVYLINSRASACGSVLGRPHKLAILGEIFQLLKGQPSHVGVWMSCSRSMIALASTPISLSMLSQSRFLLENFFSSKCLMMHTTGFACWARGTHDHVAQMLRRCPHGCPSERPQPRGPLSCCPAPGSTARTRAKKE